MNEDQEQLKLLSIFHYVVGGMAGLFACFPIIHFGIGVAILVAGKSDEAAIGGVMAAVAAILIVLGWVFAVFVLVAGRRLARRTNYMFCLVMGGVECIFMPFGTVLGVFTIIVLQRPSVKELFGVRVDRDEPEALA